MSPKLKHFFERNISVFFLIFFSNLAHASKEVKNLLILMILAKSCSFILIFKANIKNKNSSLGIF